jgi:hypothetical protein
MGLRQRCSWYLALISVFIFLTVQFSHADEVKNPLKEASYTNQQLLSEMLLVNASEQTLDKVPALAITFSQDLDTNKDPSEFFTVTQNGKAVEGQWMVVNNLRRVYFTQIQPNTVYRIQIRPGLSAKNGLQLLKPVDFEIKTRDIQPAFDFASKGSLLPTQLASGLPIRVVNVPELDVELLRVQPEKLGEVLKAIRLDNTLQSWELEEIHALTNSVYTTRYPTNTKPNARETFVLPLAQIEALQQPGLYFAVIRQPGRFTDKAYRITHFVVTNIGLQARVYSKNLEVFAHALDSGKPMRGLKIAIKDAQSSLEKMTDEQGRVSFAQYPPKDFYITANLDGQFAFLDLRSAPLDLTSFAIQGLPEQTIAPFIYSSRALYRPGDSVDLNILLRDIDGLVVTNKDLHLSIVRPDTRVIWEDKLSARSADLAYYLHYFSLPDDAPEGVWRAEVRVDDEEQASQVFEFKVEPYQAERTQLALSVGKPLLTKEDKQIVSLHGSYFHGAPAAKQAIKAKRNLQLERKPLTAYQDYVFGVPEDIERLASLELPEFELDAQGNGFLEFPPIPNNIQSPLKTTVQASLLELGSRPVSNEISQAYWPAQHLVGLKPLFENATVALNSEAHFDIVRIDPTGQLLAAQQLTATLFKESYDYSWEYVADKGWQQTGVRTQYPVSQQVVELAAGQLGHLALPVKEGQYRLELEDGDTKLKVAYVFTAGWQATTNSSTQPNILDLKLDKAAYQLGELAQVSVSLPAKSEVLVTVEGGQLLWSKQLSLPEGTSTIEVPIEDSWQRHDLYLAVQALQVTGTGSQNLPQRRFGLVPLKLDRSERQLQLSLEAPESTMAEQELKVLVKASNLKSKDALLTLSAVDTRILDKAPSAYSDPFTFYFASHAYEPRLYDAYNQIISSGELVNFSPKPLTLPKALKPLEPELAEQLLALSAEPVKFDAEGKAEVTLKLPPFTGSLELQAVAIGAEQLASVQKRIQVISPIELSVDNPRFLAAGDSAKVTIKLKNTSDEDQLLQLKLASNSLFEGIAQEKELSLSKGQSETLALPLSAVSALGLGQINLEVKGKGFDFKRELLIPIRPAYAALQAYEQHELVGLASSIALKHLPTDYLAATAETCISIADTPPLPVTALLKTLMHYPYDSLEQTVSSTYPYLFLDEAAIQKWSLPALSMAQRQQRVQEALLRLRSLQLPKGGFSAWAKVGYEEYWLNSYVTSFLLDARKQGFAIPDDILDAALANLQESWKQETPQLEERYPMAENAVQMDLAVRAYTAYVLAKEHKLTLNDLKSFADKSATQMELGLPLVHLGLALTLQGDAKRGDELIQRGLRTLRKPDLYIGDYGSPLRDRAMMLYQLLLAEQTIPVLSVHLGHLQHDLESNQDLSTQEQVFVVLLGQLLDKQAKATWKAELKVNDQVIELNQAGSFNQCFSEFTADSKLTTQNENALYMNSMGFAYPKLMPSATDKPIRVQRKWYDLTGKSLNTEDLKIGDLVLTRLNIESAEPIPHALIVDLLPTGFELERADIQANEVLQALKLDDMAVSVAETMAYSAVNHESFWDDRYVVNLELKAKASRAVFYLARVTQAVKATVPQTTVTDLDRPYIHGFGVGVGILQTGN